MGGVLKFVSIWRNRALNQVALFHLVTASLVLSMVVVCGMYMFIPSTLDSGGRTLVHLRAGRELRKLVSRDLGRFGTKMVDMVAHDLPFTIFVPIEEAVEKLVRSCARSADYMEKENLRIGKPRELAEINSSTNSALREASVSRCLSAVVSRIMSFSTVPKQIVSRAVVEGREMELESLSGFKLYLAFDPRRGLVVNNHTLLNADIRRGLLVIHIIDGVLMDSMFERSLDFEDEVVELSIAGEVHAILGCGAFFGMIRKYLPTAMGMKQEPGDVLISARMPPKTAAPVKNGVLSELSATNSSAPRCNAADLH